MCIGFTHKIRAQSIPEHFATHAVNLLKPSTDSLFNLEEKKIWVFIFFSPDCPLCQKLTLTLNELCTLFSNKNITWVAVFNSSYTPLEIKNFVEEYRFQLPYAMDYKWKFAAKYKATVTPEVIVFNNQSDIIYRGLIDNSLEKVGVKRNNINKHYLKDVLTAWVNNQRITTKYTVPVGCYIEYD